MRHHEVRILLVPRFPFSRRIKTKEELTLLFGHAHSLGHCSRFLARQKVVVCDVGVVRAGGVGFITKCLVEGPDGSLLT